MLNSSYFYLCNICDFVLETVIIPNYYKNSKFCIISCCREHLVMWKLESTNNENKITKIDTYSNEKVHTSVIDSGESHITTLSRLSGALTSQGNDLHLNQHYWAENELSNLFEDSTSYNERAKSTILYLQYDSNYNSGEDVWSIKARESFGTCDEVPWDLLNG